MGQLIGLCPHTAIETPCRAYPGCPVASVVLNMITAFGEPLNHAISLKGISRDSDFTGRRRGHELTWVFL